MVVDSCTNETHAKSKKMIGRASSIAKDKVIH